MTRDVIIDRFDWGFTCDQEMIFCARSNPVGTQEEMHRDPQEMRVFISGKARNAEIPHFWTSLFGLGPSYRIILC